MAPMVTNRIVRGWAGLFFIAAGLFAGILCGLATLSLIPGYGPIAIFGVIGGICAIITGARWVRQATRPEGDSSVEESQQLV